MKKYIQRVLKWVYIYKPEWKKELSYHDNGDAINLIIKLMNEETGELHCGLLNNDKEEIIDAIVDLFWISLNAAALKGITAEEISNYFPKVMKSNYSKICSTEQEAIDTVNMYSLDGSGQKIAYYKKIDGFYLVYRTQDNKILKSKNYTHARLS